MGRLFNQTLKANYRLLPLKKKLLTLFETVFKESEPIYRHLNFMDTFKVKLNDSFSMITKDYGLEFENIIFYIDNNAIETARN